MTWKRTLALVLTTAVVLAGIGGCAPDPATPTTDSSVEDAPIADSGGRVIADTLPAAPGYSWDIATYTGPEPLPVQFGVAGPWTITASSDWPVRTTEIVDPADVPDIEAFGEFDFVLKAAEGPTEYYYPRQMTDEWMLQLGKVAATGDAVAEPYSEPMRLWPLDFDIDDSFVVFEGTSFRIDATVLAKGTAVVPAGEIEDAYLLRFEYTPLTEGAIEGTHYYILAPDVGFVAQFSPASGDEATGFTALASAQVLMTLPEKR